YTQTSGLANALEARAGAVRSRSISGLGRNGRALAIAFKVLMCRLLRRRARYGSKGQLFLSSTIIK
ncbi:hypothetical protein PZ06_14350, partial [Lacticaseibacillus rhamnosus]